MQQNLSLQKGQSLCLDKPGQQLNRAIIGVGWKEKSSMQSGAAFDVDSCILLLKADDVIGDVAKDFIYPDINETHPSGTIRHGGDNTEGGDGIHPDENIELDLSSVPDIYRKAMVLISVYNAEERRQNFGSIDKYFAEVKNVDTDEVLAKIDNQDMMEFGTATAIHVGSFVRANDGKWHFKNESIGFDGGLNNFFKKYNVNITGG